MNRHIIFHLAQKTKRTGNLLFSSFRTRRVLRIKKKKKMTRINLRRHVSDVYSLLCATFTLCSRVLYSLSMTDRRSPSDVSHAYGVHVFNAQLQTEMHKHDGNRRSDCRSMKNQRWRLNNNDLIYFYFYRSSSKRYLKTYSLPDHSDACIFRTGRDIAYETYCNRTETFHYQNRSRSERSRIDESRTLLILFFFFLFF